MFGGIIAGLGGLLGGAASVAASAVSAVGSITSTAISSTLSGAGSLASGAGSLAGGALETTSSLAGGALKTTGDIVGGTVGAVGAGTVGITKSVFGTSEEPGVIQTLANILPKAGEIYGNVMGMLGKDQQAVTSPMIAGQAALPTLPNIIVPAGGTGSPTYVTAGQGQAGPNYIMLAALGVGAYLLLKKK